ncbi:MAG: hypothetical protein LLG15_01545 [Betaproteobacteria bacterium]|nr:hypothetical protein [Betaproteobacteria bacterium]
MLSETAQIHFRQLLRLRVQVFNRRLGRVFAEDSTDSERLQFHDLVTKCHLDGFSVPLLSLVVYGDFKAISELTDRDGNVFDKWGNA